MAVRIISIAMIALGVIGIVITGIVYGIAGGQVKNIGATLEVAEETVGVIGSTLETLSGNIGEILTVAGDTSGTISTGIDGLVNYLHQTGDSILNIQDQLALENARDNIANIRKHLQTAALPLKSSEVANLRQTIEQSQLPVTSVQSNEFGNSLGTFRNSLVNQQSYSAQDLLARIEQLTGYVLIPADDPIIQAFESNGIKFTQENGWLQIAGPDVVKVATVLEEYTGLDMSGLQMNGAYMTEYNMVSELMVDEPIKTFNDAWIKPFNDNLTFIEVQKGVLVNNLKIVEKEADFIAAQIKVAAASLAGVEGSLDVVSGELGFTGNTLSELGNQLSTLNGDIMTIGGNLGQVSLPMDLQSVAAGLKEIQISPVLALVNSLLSGLAALMILGSILFILAGMGLLLVDIRQKGMGLMGAAASGFKA